MNTVYDLTIHRQLEVIAGPEVGVIGSVLGSVRSNEHGMTRSILGIPFPT